MFHFPEVFQKLRDEYIYAMIRKIAEEDVVPDEEGESTPPINMIDVYLGNLHVSPVSRLWNTQPTQLPSKSDKETPSKPKAEEDNEEGDDEYAKGKGRKLASNAKNEKKSLSNKFIDFDSIHSMKVDTNELAEHKIEK